MSGVNNLLPTQEIQCSSVLAMWCTMYINPPGPCDKKYMELNPVDFSQHGQQDNIPVEQVSNNDHQMSVAGVG